MYTFEVASPRGRAEEGVVHIPATWQHKPALLPALVGEL
jgi:hypothetical protein